FPGNNWWDLDTLANFGWTPCLRVGTHTVMYIAEDDCGNTSSCEFELTVRDLVPPVAVCDETTTVAIGTDDPFDCYTSADGCEFAGVTWVKASTFDDGSYDNCNDVKFTVRRMQPYSDCINQLSTNPCYLDEFGDLVFSEQDIAKMELDSIKFYCCEVGTTQTIVLTVYQVDVNGNFIIGLDGSPVRNECMIQVEVQDKLRPICQAPAQVNVNCENFDPSLWAYGKAEILDNCCLDTSRVYQGQCGLTHTANYALFDTVCNKGTITRTFRAFDCHGQSSQCTQRVIVTYEQDYFVRFPNDVIVTQCDGTGVYGEPTFFGEDCELLGVSFEDEIFTVVPDACFKIERTWKIINWCTFDPNLPFIQVPNPNPNPISNNPANLPGPIVSPLGTLAP
ncbi:MAG: HYR domain-containing protein, partial [Saprospiraceae bacterium]|nr:HYR domain-containing protein [Saprospiraceae bacterium]